VGPRAPDMYIMAIIREFNIGVIQITLIFLQDTLLKLLTIEAHSAFESTWGMQITKRYGRR
jgi:hypothetical protein